MKDIYVWKGADSSNSDSYSFDSIKTIQRDIGNVNFLKFTILAEAYLTNFEEIWKKNQEKLHKADWKREFPKNFSFWLKLKKLWRIFFKYPRKLLFFSSKKPLKKCKDWKLSSP